MPIPEDDDSTELEQARDALIDELDNFDAEGAAGFLADSDCVEDGIEYAIELQESLAELTRLNDAFLSLARKEVAEAELDPGSRPLGLLS